MTNTMSLPTPLGPLTLVSDGGSLTAVLFDDTGAAGDDAGDAVLAAAREQLAAFLAGERRDFDLPLRPAGTPFQQEVWAALRELPYGETIGYGALAARLGRPGAARAVGLANGRNPLPVIVPCHRVIGASGALTGYGGGLERKRFLLGLEARVGRGERAGLGRTSTGPGPRSRDDAAAPMR
jgi:methylated-DNA-[protein]-cysteine S-methyltransferase